jgi:hypothetical protein
MQNIEIQYLTDAEGNKKAVMISIEEWNKIEAQFNELIQYTTLKSGLKEAFLEVKDIIAGKKKGQSLKDFLNEC